MNRLVLGSFTLTLGLCVLSCNVTAPGVEGLTDPNIRPRVIYTYPPANTEGPYEDFSYPAIEVRFNKIMNRPSVRRAVSLSSSLGDVRADTNYVYSFGGDIFQIVASSNPAGYPYNFHWRVAQPYSLDISSSAKDVNGNQLIPAFSMTFMPEPYFRVRTVYPQNGASDVYTYSSIYLYFNSPVDTSVFSSIQITPAPQGRWRLDPYPDSSNVYFSYTGPGWLANNTSYTITVHTTARDKYGHQLSQQFTSSFTTQSFRVNSTYPYNGSTGVYLNNSISAYFNGAVDTGTVRTAFTISPAIPGYFTMYDGSDYFSFTPTNGFTSSTQYNATISTALRSKGGGNLSTPFSFSFTTASFFVTSTDPYNGQSNVSRSTSISVYLTGSPDTSTLRNAFGISPNVAGSFTSYDQGSYFYFSPNTILAAYQAYTVSVDSTLRSRSGSRLLAPYTFSFTTGN